MAQPTRFSLNFVYDTVTTSIVTLVAFDVIAAKIHPEPVVNDMSDIYNYLSKVHNLPRASFLCFSEDFRTAQPIHILGFNQNFNGLVTETITQGSTSVTQYVVWYTYIAEEPSKWSRKNVRIEKIVLNAITQVDAEINSCTFQLIDVFRQFDVAPFSNDITGQKHLSHFYQAVHSALVKDPLNLDKQTFSDNDRATIVGALNTEYDQHHKTFVDIREYVIKLLDKLEHNIKSIKHNFDQLRDNANKIELQKNVAFSEALNEYSLSVPPTDLHNPDNRIWWGNSPERRSFVATATSQGYDVVRITNFGDIQKATGMLDQLRCDRDKFTVVLEQLETRKRLWVARDQLLMVVKMLNLWKESRDDGGYYQKTELQITSSKTVVSTSDMIVMGQGSTFTCVPKFNTDLKFQ